MKWVKYEEGVGRRKIVFFFFQAEDGIRGIGVTGVQTCALPILKSIKLCNQRKEYTR